MPSSTRRIQPLPARGFGVPNAPADIDPPCFKVEIPRTARAVVISEDFGITAATGVSADYDIDSRFVRQDGSVIRCELPNRHWTRIRRPIEQTFRTRLKEKNIDSTDAHWRVGQTNLVQRLLGREMCVLAWAIESVEPEDPKGLVAKAISSWQGLRPEERWWLYSMAVGQSGLPCHADQGWRAAIRIALTEGATPTAYRTSLFDA